MTEAYKVGITVAMNNLLSAELAKIGNAFTGLHGQAKGLELTLGTIAKIGAGAAMVGTVALLVKGVEEASKFETELAKFRLYGMGDKINEDAKNLAVNMKVAGVSFTDYMRLINEAQGVFRESGRDGDSALEGAKIAAPTLAKLAFIAKAQGKGDDHSESLALLRWADMMGGAQNPTRFNELANVGFRISSTSGGQVDYEGLRQFRARSKSAGFNVSDDMYAMLEPIIGELRGMTAGTALSTAYNRAHGITKPPNAGVDDLIKYRLWDAGAIQRNSLGGIKHMSRDPLNDAALYDSNIVQWYLTYVKPAYDKANLTPSQRVRENALMFGGTGGNLMSLIDRQSGVISNSFAAYQKAQTIDQAQSNFAGTPSGKVVELSAEWDKTMTHLGEVVMPLVNGGLDAVTKFLEALNALLGGHPQDIGNLVPHSKTMDNLFDSIFNFDGPVDHGGFGANMRHALGGSDGSGTPNQTIVMKVDGRTLGQVVTGYQISGMSKMPNSSSSPDGRMSLIPVDY